DAGQVVRPIGRRGKVHAPVDSTADRRVCACVGGKPFLGSTQRVAEPSRELARALSYNQLDAARSPGPLQQGGLETLIEYEIRAIDEVDDVVRLARVCFDRRLVHAADRAVAQR